MRGIAEKNSGPRDFEAEKLESIQSKKVHQITKSREGEYNEKDEQNEQNDDLSLLNDNVAAVGSDEHTSGKFQGEFLAEYFKEKGKKDISYVLLKD